MSIRKVKTFIGERCTAKVYRDSYNDEYLVRFHYPQPVGYLYDADYYTNDKGDAFNTAEFEASR